MENNLSKGLVRNFENEIQQPANSYSFGLNLTTEINSQEKINEPGNKLIHTLPAGYVQHGSIPYNDEVYIFSTSNRTGITEIAVVKDDKYEVVLKEKLGLRSQHNISGEIRIKNNCCKIIYFRDGNEKDMYLDVSNIPSYYDNNKNFQLEKLYFNKDISIPNIDSITVQESGGLLEYGSYSFVFEILDENKNVLYKTDPTLPVRIIPNDLADEYDTIGGAYNEDIQSPEIGGKPKVRKSISVNLSNLDTIYAYVRANIIIYATGDGYTNKVVVDPSLINLNEKITYTFTGINNNFINGDLAALTIPFIKYDRSEVFEQVQGRLLKANVKEKAIDFSTFQSFASKIKTKYKIKEVPIKDAKAKGNSKYPDSEFIGYMGDEIYAVNIEYIFNDGYVSPEFHVPGTCIDQYDFPKKVLNKKIVFTTKPIVPNVNYHYDLGFYLNGVYNQIEVSNNGKELKEFFLFEYSDPDDVWSLDIPKKAESTTKTGGNPVTLTINKDSYFYTVSSIVPPKIVGQSNKTKILSTITQWTPDIEHIFSSSEYAKLKPENKLKHWQVYNTAVKLDSTSGLMSYYEGSNKYPIILNCNKESIWGVDACGNPLTGRPIRHHKFPDNLTEPLYDGQNVRIKGFEFTNIEYPHPDIIGHRFLVSIRDEFNRTILDKGIMGNMIEPDEELPGGGGVKPVGFSWFLPDDNFSKRNFYFFSPKVQYQKGYLNGEYIKLEGIYRTSPPLFKKEVINKDGYDGVGKGTTDVDFYLEHGTIIYDGIINKNVQFTNRKIDESFILKRLHSRVISSLNKKFISLSQDNDINVLRFGRDYVRNYLYDLSYVSVKVNNNPYEDLFSIRTRRTHNNIQKSKSIRNRFDVFGGDTYINDYTINNVFIRSFTNGFQDLIITGLIIVGATALAILTLGAAIPASIGLIVTAGAILGTVSGLVALGAEIMEQTKNGTYDSIIIDGLNYNANNNLPINGVKQDAINYSCERVVGIVVESEINIGYNNSGTNPASVVYRNGNIDAYFREKILYWDDKTNPGKPGYNAFPVSLGEYYSVNEDYHILDKFHVSNILPISYDYCSKCRNNYPYRIIYSFKSFNEDRADNYLNFGANNYIDIPSDRGKILSLKYKEGKLFVFTELSTFLLQPNPQILKTDSTEVYLGTGDFLAIPPQELIPTDLGYGGITNQYSVINSKNGLTWVTNNREIINYSGGIKIISLPIYKDLKDNLTKDTYLSFNNQKDILYLRCTSPDRSNFTLSYNYKDESWISYHSYLPDNMFYNSEFYYSTTNVGVYKHLHDGNFGNFYGTTYPSVIRFVSNSLTTETLNSIFFLAKFNSDTNFNKIMCHTSMHNTGLVNLNYINQNKNPYGNIVNNKNELSIIKTDENYKISNLYDKAINNPNISKNWNDIKPYLPTYGFLDMVPINIDLNKSPYDLSNLKDKWISIMLVYTPINYNDKMNLLMFFPNQNNSIR